jgi:hypothetical protein
MPLEGHWGRIKQGEHAEAEVSTKDAEKLIYDAEFIRVRSPIKSASGLSTLSTSSEHLSQRFRMPKC